MKVTLDSDVLAYAFIKPDKDIYKERYEEFEVLHNKADILFKDVIKGNYELIIPSTVLIEVAIVMSRAVGSEIAKMVYEHIMKHTTEVLYLNENFTHYCMERGIKTHLSGFDTVVFSCACYMNSVLVTNDRRFFRNLKNHHPEVITYYLKEMDVKELEQL